MAILVDEGTKVVVAGITGSEGTFHSLRNRTYGTDVVAGVTPGKGGRDVEGIPVFDTSPTRSSETGANTSLIFVPARFAPEAILEAADAGIGLVVCITEGIPVRDMAQVVAYLRGIAVPLVGPNCPGVISPGRSNVGIIPGEICTPGRVGLVCGSGTLTYQIVHELTQTGSASPRAWGWGRPGPRHRVHRVARAVRGRPRDRPGRDDRRDRRRRRGAAPPRSSPSR